MIPFLSIIAEHYIIVLFLFLNLAIGFWAHTKAKTNSFEDYALASRSLPTGVLVMTLLGTFIGAGTLLDPEWAYKYGILQAMGSIFYIISFVLIGTFVAPFLVYFTGCITTGDLMKIFYGRAAQIMTGGIGCLFSLLIISSQIHTLGDICDALIGMPRAYGILTFGIVGTMYSVYGGMRSVSYTDVLQTAFVLLIFAFITQTLLEKIGGFQTLLNELPSDRLSFFQHPSFYKKLRLVSFWVIFPSFLLTPPIVQRMLISDDKRKIRKMWYLSALLYGFLSFLIIIIGLGTLVGRLKLDLGTSRQKLLPRLIQSLFDENSFAINTVFIGFAALLLSTIDSYLHSVGISFVHDFIEPIKKTKIDKNKKVAYTRVVIGSIGLLSTVISLFEETRWLTNMNFYTYTVCLSPLFIVPLILGIIGIKTDQGSFIAFCSAYLASILGVYWVEWRLEHFFYIALLLGIIAYFITHIYINGGIVTLKRSELTVAERLWLPRWSGFIKKMTSWIKAPLHLPTLASRKVVNNPTHSLSFSMLIFALYTFSSVMTGGGNDLGLANFMAGVHVVGITLCAGLMLEGIWPARLKPYFALYWFFTLFYCLAFGSTLAFLRAHESTIAVGKWIANFILLFALVDSMSFITLSCLGASLAMALWYVVFGSIPADLLGSIGLLGVYLLFILLVVVVLFERSKERDLKERFYLKSAFSHAMTHESRQPLSEISVLSTLQQRAIDELSPMPNAQGEKGFWIPASKQGVLQKGSQQIGKAVQEIKHEFGRFNKLIEDEISTLEREKVSMQSLIESIVPTLPKKHTNRIKVKVECTKDFEVSVVRPLFANVLTNLLKNAYLHGNASEMHIHIEGGKRKLSIRDNGRGIKVEALPRIFELHFTTGGQASSGVGLALVKSIVQASGGKISCHSRHGDKESFTEFVMEFPEV